MDFGILDFFLWWLIYYDQNETSNNISIEAYQYSNKVIRNKCEKLDFNIRRFNFQLGSLPF